MKKYLILLILSSFLLGVVFVRENISLLSIELYILRNLKYQFSTLGDIFKVVILFTFHIGLILLLYFAKFRHFKIYLVIIPSGLLFSYLLNVLLFVLIEPIYLVSTIPFIVMWIICLINFRSRRFNNSLETAAK